MRPMRLLPSHVVHVVLLVPSLASESFQQSVTPVSAPSMLNSTDVLVKSVVLFQIGTAPSRLNPNVSKLMPQRKGSALGAVLPKAPEHVNLLGMLAQMSRKVATALGVTDIISLCVLGLVVLLALYFVWGGSVDSLKENPYGELKQTGERAGREAKDKFNQWKAQQGQASPGGQFAEAEKINAINSRRAELLQEQKALAKGLRRLVGEDIVVQRGNVKAQQVAVKKSRQLFAPMDCRHTKLPSEESDGLPQALQNVLRVSQELDALQKEVHQLQKAERHEQQHGTEVAVNTLHDWFGRYGEPHRQSQPIEMARSCIMKPRRLPFLGTSNAVALRKGHLIK
ncbi:Uncharacterized protein SCF082_LOCUS27288 [Durusdinium trenchii]|uniref:Uncharacterized protein n=1 Tax=Durusdinium trenchii TaxID=1381693 RepID=A0ABP0MDH0_9DINO